MFTWEGSKWNWKFGTWEGFKWNVHLRFNMYFLFDCFNASSLLWFFQKVIMMTMFELSSIRQKKKAPRRSIPAPMSSNFLWRSPPNPTTHHITCIYIYYVCILLNHIYIIYMSIHMCAFLISTHINIQQITATIYTYYIYTILSSKKNIPVSEWI